MQDNYASNLRKESVTDDCSIEEASSTAKSHYNERHDTEDNHNLEGCTTTRCSGSSNKASSTQSSTSSGNVSPGPPVYSPIKSASDSEVAYETSSSCDQSVLNSPIATTTLPTFKLVGDSVKMLIYLSVQE